MRSSTVAAVGPIALLLASTCAAAPAAKPEPTAREHAQNTAIYAEVAEFCPPFIKVKVPAVPGLEQHHITRGRKLSTNFDQIMREEVERTCYTIVDEFYDAAVSGAGPDRRAAGLQGDA